MYRSYKDQGLVFIGIHGDKWDEAVAKAKDAGIEYPITNDDGGKTMDAYGVGAFPTIYVLDKKGVVRYIDPPHLGETVKELLAE